VCNIVEERNSLSMKGGSSIERKSISSSASIKTQSSSSKLEYSKATLGFFVYSQTRKDPDEKISSQAGRYPRYRIYSRDTSRRKSFIESIMTQEIEP